MVINKTIQEQVKELKNNLENPDSFTLATVLNAIEYLIDQVYLEDCHISYNHFSNHTPTSICQEQMSKIAERVIQVVYGVDLKKEIYDDINKIPRKLTNRYYTEEEKEALEKWQREGYRH